MPTHRRHRSRRSTRKRRSSDPVPEYVIAKLTTNAKDNQALVAHFRALCERELAKPRPDRSQYRASRLRQLLSHAAALGCVAQQPTTVLITR